MSPYDLENWRRLSPHLDQVLDMDDEERRASLATIRAGDPTLADELEQVLGEHAVLAEEGFLEPPRPASGDDAGAVSYQPFGMGEVTLAGKTLGPYTLISHLGEGGMGSVWLARRSDGAFEGQVAIKLLNASLFGRAGERRFRHEAMVLARLTHPSIAHLIDAGISSLGQAYLILEYVRGEHLDRYCNSHRLDIKSRIRLFLDVLPAVAHAHTNLVVHRDIKPSNVLVRTDTLGGGTPEAADVKLLDFGIAKLLEADPETGMPVLTRDSGWAMTPEFASPEQLTGGAITTATDIYALGLLLYMLLAGRHPVGDDLKSPARLIDVVVNNDAPRLSTMASATKAGGAQALAEIAAERSTTPDRLRRAVRGDLDTILAKALKRDPRERYASVTAFADDLRRYLAQLPISARPDTLRYRATTFVRRNRMPAALGVAGVVALTVGIAGTITQAKRATEQATIAGVQRDFALRQLTRVEALNDLNQFLLSETVPAEKPFTALDLLGRAEAIVDRQQESDENHIEMLISLGTQYWGLSHEDKSLRLLTRAYELSRGLPDPGTHARAACALATVVGRHGGPGSPDGDVPRAEQLIQEGLRILPNEPQYVLHRIFCNVHGSELAMTESDRVTTISRAEAAMKALNASRVSSPLLEARVMEALGMAYYAVGRYPEAAPLFEQTARRLTALGRDDTKTAVTLYGNWGHALFLLGRPLEAEPILRRTIAKLGNANAAHRHGLPLTLARTLIELNQPAEAAALAEEATTLATAAKNVRYARMARLSHATAVRQMGDLDGAERLLASLEASLDPKAMETSVLQVSIVSERSVIAETRGDLPGALVLANRAIDISINSMGSAVSRTLIRRSQIALQNHQIDLAIADAREALAKEQKVAVSTSYNVGRAQLALGRALRAKGNPDDARTALSAAATQLTSTLGPTHPDTRLALELLASR